MLVEQLETAAVAAGAFPLVLAGSIPVERAFGTPGLGYAMFTAVSERDVF